MTDFDERVKRRREHDLALTKAEKSKISETRKMIGIDRNIYSAIVFVSIVLMLCYFAYLVLTPHPQQVSVSFNCTEMNYNPTNPEVFSMNHCNATVNATVQISGIEALGMFSR